MPSDQETLLQDLVQSWTAPVWFSRGIAESPAEVNDSGSCGFIRSGSHRLLVTAWHVLEEFRAAKRTNPETLFAVNIGNGNTVGLSEPNVIAESSHLDLATIEFPHLDLNAGATTKAYFPLDWYLKCT